MKNAIIYTFSGTGNTRKIAKLYADEFEKNDVRCTVFDIKAGAEAPQPCAYDYVGFAYPVHGFNAPEIMLTFADGLKNSFSSQIYFLLTSSGEPLSLNNISSIKLDRILKRKGYTKGSEYHYTMPYNMIFRHTDEQATKMWNTAKALCPIEAREVLYGKRHELKRIPFGSLISFAFRIEHPAMKVNGRYFKVDESKCLHCGACVKNCPEGNITFKDGKFEFGGDCVMCARCSFNCPVNAIDIGILNGWKVNGKYDMNSAEKSVDDRHSRYCRRAYERYFADAEKKIAGNADSVGIE